jgi:hypothetical protein
MNGLKWCCAGLIPMLDLVIVVLVVEGRDEKEIVLPQLCSSVSCQLKRKKAAVSWRTLEKVYLDACRLSLNFWY